MKITFVLPNLQLYGGIKSTIQMAEALQQLGHGVSIVHPRLPSRDGLPLWNVRKTAVQVVRFLQSFGKTPSWFRFSGRLLQVPYIAERYLPQADVLVLTWWANVETLHQVSADKGAVVHFARSFEIWGGPPERVKAVYSLSIPRITNSDFLSSQLPVAPICTIANGLDDVFLEQPLQRQISPVVSIGLLYRHQDWKRMDDALEVMNRLAKANDNLRFILFGEPIKREHQSLLSSVGDYEYSRLPSGNDLVAIYQKMDIFLFTSDETEAFGNPPLEAMAAGCAVVTTKVGGIATYSEDGITALHAEPRDVEVLTAHSQRLISEPNYRSKLASLAQESALKNSWSNQAAKFQRVIEMLVTDESSQNDDP